MRWADRGAKGNFRPKAQFFTVKSCFVRLLSAKADGGQPSHRWAPRRTAQHAWMPGWPQQRGGGHPSWVRWLLLNHHQLLRSFTQQGRSWTRLINDKNTCLSKNLFLGQSESQLPAPPSPLLWRHKYLQINVFFLFEHQECTTFQLLLIQVLQWWFCQKEIVYATP